MCEQVSVIKIQVSVDVEVSVHCGKRSLVAVLDGKWSVTFGYTICIVGYTWINRNMPVVAGGLKWSQQLEERIQILYNNFRYISYP